MRELIIVTGLVLLAMAAFICSYIAEQKELEDYQCYLKKSYKHEAMNGYCRGEDGNVRCGHCLYYKQWKRRNYHE